MRRSLASLALILTPCALSACATAHHDSSTRNWRKEAMAQCQKETDPIEHQTCLDEIAAVQHERDKIQ